MKKVKCLKAAIQRAERVALARGGQGFQPRRRQPKGKKLFKIRVNSMTKRRQYARAERNRRTAVLPRAIRTGRKPSRG